MQTNDYILKTIEALSRLVAKMIGLKERGQYTEALKEIQIFKDTMLDSIQDDQLCFDLLGKFYMVEGDLHASNNDRDIAQQCYSKALEHFKKADIQTQTYCFEREELIVRIKSKLKNKD